MSRSSETQKSQNPSINVSKSPLPTQVYTPPQREYYIIQKINQTYLTVKKDGSIIFEHLHTVDRSCQKWFIYRSKSAEEHFKALHFSNINEIVPVTQPKNVLCMNETGDGLLLKSDTTKSMCTYWEFENNGPFGDYRVYKDEVYTGQTKILSAKFLGKLALYDPFVGQLSDAFDEDESQYLMIQTSSIVKPIFIIKGPVISYDFDGVLHLSIKPDPQFHEKLERATYHPLNFMTDKLVPFKEMLLQLKHDYESGHQIIIVTARPESSDKYVRQYLINQKVDQYIDQILYISNKTPFLKAIKAVKHYDDSPKQIIPMMKAGVNVIQVDPPLNRFWIPDFTEEEEIPILIETNLGRKRQRGRNGQQSADKKR